MTLRAGSRLERVLHETGFGVTAEVVPPRSAEARLVEAQAEGLLGYADAVNVTDNPTSSAHMSAVAGAAIVARAGLEPVLQVTTRDRNRLALTADLLGGWALGARNLLCLTGDPPGEGDHPDATEVYDLSVTDLVGFAVRLRDEGLLLSGRAIPEPPRFFVGVADVPLAPGYDPARLEAKLDAGADFVQTQIVFDLDALAAWAERIRPAGVFERAFFLVGVTPLRGPRTARFIRDRLGISVPDAVIDRLEAAGDEAPEEGVRIAVEAAAGVRRIPGLSGVHVMGLGHDEGVRRTIEAAGLLPRPSAELPPAGRDS